MPIHRRLPRSGEPMTDPDTVVEDAALRRAGWTPQRDIVRRQGRVERFPAQPPLVVPGMSVGPWQLSAIAASTDAQMLIYSPTSSTVFRTTNNVIYTPIPLRLVGGWMMSNPLVTAGTLTLAAQIFNPDLTSTTYLLGAVLDGAGPTNLREASFDAFPYDIAPVIPAGGGFRARLQSSAGLAPLTTNVTAMLVVVPEFG